MSATTPVEVITDAVDGLQGQMLTVAGAGVAIGVAILVVRKGYRLVRGFF